MGNRYLSRTAAIRRIEEAQIEQGLRNAPAARQAWEIYQQVRQQWIAEGRQPDTGYYPSPQIAPSLQIAAAEYHGHPPWRPVVGPVLNMSNYRVRQVLALGPMPDRQLRFLIALATYMNDDSQSVKVGFIALTAAMGTSADTARRAKQDNLAAGRISYVPGSGRGNVTLWITHWPPVKGGQRSAPLSDDVKGGQPDPEKGGSDADKRGAAKSADQQERKHWLIPLAKPSGSLSSSVERAAQQLLDYGGTEREIRHIVTRIMDNTKIKAPAAYIRAAIERGDGPIMLAQARAELAIADDMQEMSRQAASSPQRSHLATGWCGQCDERTRLLELPDDKVGRCPSCHPKRAASSR